LLSLAAASASQKPRRTSASSAVNPAAASVEGQQWRVAPRMAAQHSGPMYDSPLTKKMTISLVHEPSRDSASQHSAKPPPPPPASARRQIETNGFAQENKLSSS
jgi:hypothetical protein